MAGAGGNRAKVGGVEWGREEWCGFEGGVGWEWEWGQ